LRFGNLLRKIDLFKLVDQDNIRTYEGQLIDSKKGLLALASVVDNKKVFYGFDSIYQIVLRLPVLWYLIPMVWFLKVSKIGSILYNELAVKRKIVPLHCRQKDC
jgi:predicted DCC family thiol-disulfide oxidoreductase YuxK